jgi:lipid-A-disaccharide synthase
MRINGYDDLVGPSRQSRKGGETHLSHHGRSWPTHPAERPNVRFEAAAASEPCQAYEATAGDFPIAIRSGTAHQLMQRACVGMVCSGTATLEAAFFGLPYCLVYRVAWLTFEVGRRVVDVDCLGIINILNNYRQNPPADSRLPARPAPHVIREFIQHLATPKLRTTPLNHPGAGASLVSSVNAIVSTLDADGAALRAAQAILATL